MPTLQPTSQKYGVIFGQALRRKDETLVPYQFQQTLENWLLTNSSRILRVNLHIVITQVTAPSLTRTRAITYTNAD